MCTGQKGSTLSHSPCPHCTCFKMAAKLDTAGDHFQPSLNSLPDEVLQHILYYLPPYDVLASLQRVSKRFQRLASEPLLWRHHCRVLFRYWDSKHRIRQKFVGKAADVDWKMLYTHRMKVDFDTTSTLDSILSGQVNRIQKFRIIAEFGYDAKDTLLRHCHTNDEAEDVLARRQASILP
jgi:F-box protein 21